jgi:NADPH2:quinone reductase
MRAILSTQPGPADTLVLRNLDDPAPASGEVLIDVHACGVNYPDVLVIEDRYQLRPPRPFSPGLELAGVVAALGSGVTAPGVGTHVIASCIHMGGMAEKVVVPASRVVPIPNNMPFDAAAALYTTYGTSLYALKDRARLRAGETLLVLGAGGGVGLAAVELGVALGARVIAAASSAAKVALAQSRGAAVGLVYPPGPFTKDGAKELATKFKSACGPNGWDVAYDGVGGDYSEAALRASGWGGRFLVVGFPAGIAKLPLNLVLLKSCDVVGVLWGVATSRDSQLMPRQIHELLALYEQGKIRPHISARFALERAGEAIAHLAARRALGKVVVTMRA